MFAQNSAVQNNFPKTRLLVGKGLGNKFFSRLYLNGWVSFEVYLFSFNSILKCTIRLSRIYPPKIGKIYSTVFRLALFIYRLVYLNVVPCVVHAEVVVRLIHFCLSEHGLRLFRFGT